MGWIHRYIVGVMRDTPGRICLSLWRVVRKNILSKFVGAYFTGRGCAETFSSDSAKSGHMQLSQTRSVRVWVRKTKPTQASTLFKYHSDQGIMSSATRVLALLWWAHGKEFLITELDRRVHFMYLQPWIQTLVHERDVTGGSSGFFRWTIQLNAHC